MRVNWYLNPSSAPMYFLLFFCMFLILHFLTFSRSKKVIFCSIACRLCQYETYHWFALFKNEIVDTCNRSRMRKKIVDFLRFLVLFFTFYDIILIYACDRENRGKNWNNKIDKYFEICMHMKQTTKCCESQSARLSVIE